VGLSVFIICQNEERIIERTLVQARKLADELIIVDSGSTDSTLAIASKYADRVEHQDWLGYSGQKNFALGLCTQDWVLSVDADEVLTDALIAEIRMSLRAEGEAIYNGSPRRFAPRDDIPLADAYRIARKLYIGSKWIRYGGYYPDYQLRLFRRTLGSFAPRTVHESVALLADARVSDLREPLEHYAYADIAELQTSFMKYAALARKPGLILLVPLKFAYTFLWRYMFRLGFLHGLIGLQLAWIHAVYTARKYM
jgi:glycosyltransferase involved in cell wall biosynthesis